ncbi:hypothetical protein E3P99_01282 [Wallemia hederae]|uniref:Uncharacterized protein n=1 Tax=Wallemia hederae TaxID=1540922 RepID=A0A4V4LUF1_9BASI|nr:hypothetical protein E3P99_01282 [Wallemia hederae]
MKKSKPLLKNLQKADKDYDNALRIAVQRGYLDSAAVNALGTIDATGSIAHVASILTQANQNFESYTAQLFKSRSATLVARLPPLTLPRQALDQLIQQEESYALADKDRELLVSQVIKASSKKSTNGSSARLIESQKELKACENHLSQIEVDLMINRQQIIFSSLQQRLRSLLELGENLYKLADQGLDHIHSLPASTNLLENPSIDSLSPSQSASQVNDDSNFISSPINHSIKRDSNLKQNSVTEHALKSAQSQPPKPSMFTEQFSESSIQSPAPQQPQRQPLIPHATPPQSQQKPAGFLKRLFGGNKKQSPTPSRQVRHTIDKPGKKSLFSVPWGAKPPANTSRSESKRKDIDGWHTRTTSNISSLQRGDSSDEEVGAKYVSVTNKNPRATIAENLSRQSSLTSNQSQRKSKRSSQRYSQDVLRSNSLGNSKRTFALPERPSSAASLPLNTHASHKRGKGQATITNRPAGLATASQRDDATSALPPKVPSKNSVSSNGVSRKRPTSTSARNRKVVIHPNLMSIVESDNADHDFNPTGQSNGTPKTKGKEREHLPASRDNSRQSSMSSSVAPIRKDSARSSRSEQLPKNVSWAQSLPQRSTSTQWSNRPSANGDDSSDDEDDDAYNIARAQLSPLDFSNLK